MTAGTFTRSFSVGAGATRLSLSSGPGTIKGVMMRGGGTVASVSGEGVFEWVTTPVDYNFNYIVLAS